MTTLFISYARADRTIIYPLVQELQDLGFIVWIDASGLQGGKVWSSEIVKAIKECDFFLLFISSKSVESDNVRREVDLAYKNKKNIIPLRLEKVDIPLEWDYQTIGIQWIDCTDNNWKSRLLVALGDKREAPAKILQLTKEQLKNREKRFQWRWAAIIVPVVIILALMLVYFEIVKQSSAPLVTTESPQISVTLTSTAYETVESKLAQSPSALDLIALTVTAPNSPSISPATIPPTETKPLPPTSAISASSTSPPLSETPTLLPSSVPRADGMVMLYVQGGTFEMGSGDPGEPKHPVTLDAYWIDKTEVSNEQYKICVAQQKCEPPKSHIGFEGNDLPVVGVTWNKAKQYCQWVGGDLPTEAQWEYAARGPENLVYPWGNEFDYKRVNTRGADGSYTGTTPVNSFDQGEIDGSSWVGALNMAGNVYEWVNDWYDDGYYSYSLPQNPQGPAEGELKVERGGDWYADPNIGTPAQVVQATKRQASYPYGDDNRIGFRCVTSANN